MFRLSVHAQIILIIAFRETKEDYLRYLLFLNTNNFNFILRVIFQKEYQRRIVNRKVLIGIMISDNLTRPAWAVNFHKINLKNLPNELMTETAVENEQLF